jgi:hypothetical protein
MIRHSLAIGIALALCAPAAARAQSSPPISVRAFGAVGSEHFTATETFTATMGSGTGTFYGGGVEVDFRSGIFARFGGSRYKKIGERALSLDGQIYPLGIPLTVTIVPLEFTAGYRLWPTRRVVPYVGAGFGSYGYTETSEFAEAGENTSARFTGYHIVGGADVKIGGWVRAGGEVEWASVANALGKGGLSQDLGESNLGGTTIRFIVSVGR